jgi:hypothetical protein
MRGPAAKMDWGDYAPHDAGVAGPLRDAPRAVAEDHLARLLAARPVRRAQLAALIGRHGVALDPAAIGAWLVAAAPTAAGDDARWTGLVADVALWLGDRMIDAAPHLRWALSVSHRKATGYQRPVLVGFRAVADPHYYVDVAHLIASWAGLAARRRRARHDFLVEIERVTLADA